MVMMILGPVALMPNALSALKVMKKFNQKLEDRKLIDRNIIKDRQPFFNKYQFGKINFVFTSDTKLATKYYAQMYKLP